MNAKITATAHNTPEKIMTNHDLEKLVDTSDEWIRSRTGITQRHVVGENEASSDISTRIAERIFTRFRPVSKSKAPAMVKAEYSPRLCPATAAGTIPFSRSSSPIITETI